MSVFRLSFSVSTLSLVFLIGCAMHSSQHTSTPPYTPQRPVTNVLHGVEIIDPFQWLEDPSSPDVQEWTAAQNAFTYELLYSLPQRAWLSNQFETLWRNDDSSVPREVLYGTRRFFSVKKAHEDKWRYMTQEHPDAEPVLLLNPNEWDTHDTLEYATPSRDGRWLAYGVAHGGNEDPRIRIMCVETHEHLDDTFRGRKQRAISWMPDNSGFFYTSRPLPGTVPEGEEHYWETAWYHTLNTSAEDDVKIFWSDTVRENWHGAHVTEDGKYLLLYRGLFNQTDVYIAPLEDPTAYVPVVTNIDARFAVFCIDDKLYIRTNWDAPNEKVYVTPAAKPSRENWELFLPETDNALRNFSAINGHFFATYLHNAHSLIRVFTKEGKHLHDVPLPEPGTASVSGHWSKPPVYLSFTSFTHLPTTFDYDIATQERTVLHTSPIPLDMSDCTVTQVWFTSRDGTAVPMFIAHRKDMQRNGKNPTLLTAYGGFHIPRVPRFSSVYALWIKNGGIVAIPNLRGGGEFGQEWHTAGKRGNKQNVFDDCIAATEFLIRENYTRPENIVASGGSNGGLLMGAIAVQRPDLYNAIVSSVPLLDMVRYHLFGLANIWSEEYGSAEDPEEFQWLYAYSPYHNVQPQRHPVMLFIGSENDARTDPLHARKMAARMQTTPENTAPSYLLMRDASGHGGGVTLSQSIAQSADTWAFLMHFAGITVPDDDTR